MLLLCGCVFRNESPPVGLDSTMSEKATGDFSPEEIRSIRNAKNERSFVLKLASEGLEELPQNRVTLSLGADDCFADAFGRRITRDSLAKSLQACADHSDDVHVLILIKDSQKLDRKHMKSYTEEIDTAIAVSGVKKERVFIKFLL
jgi:hypothetical protein